MRRSKIILDGGSSLIEVLIALAILTLGISASVLLAFGNQSLEIDNETNSEALYLAKSLLEEARADSIFDFNLVNSTTSSQYSGSLLYTKKLSVEQTDLFTKQATSTVTWQEGGRILSIFLPTIFTNPEAVSGGDTCSSELLGDWTNPQKAEYEFGAHILGDTSSGFPITSIQTFNQKMYVTVDNNNGNNDETFFILDISNPSNMPNQIGKLDNATVGRGLNSVAVDGNEYAFVANANDPNFRTCSQGPNCSQLQVIDISDASNPSVEFNFKFPTSTTPYVYNTSNNSGQAVGKSIFYKDGYLYLGLSSTGNGPGFHIFNVSDPLNPQWISSWPLASPSFGSSGAPINSINVKNNYAYLAHPNGLNGASSEQLTVLDISDPSNPQRVSGFTHSTGVGGNGKSSYLVGSKLYFGRTASNIGGSSDSIPELFILNNSVPSNIPSAALGSLPLSTAESVNGIIVRNFLAFLITNTQFQIWRVDNPSNITQYAAPLTLPPGSGGGLQGTATDCEGNYIFVGSQSSNDKGYISIITSTP